MNPDPRQVPDSAENDAKPRSKDFVRSLERGLSVIRALGTTSNPMTLSEVAAEAGIPRAAARRFLITLNELAYVEGDGRRFRLTPRVMELGYGYLSGLSHSELAIPHVERLVTEVKQPSEGAVLDGGEIVYILRVLGPNIMSSNVNIGARMPAHATALGKVLLANLSDEKFDAYLKRTELRPYTDRTVTDPGKLREDINQAKADGYALVNQELEPGLCAIAVPIHSRNGDAEVALNVSSSIVHHTPETLLSDVLPHLQKTATDIMTDLAASSGT